MTTNIDQKSTIPLGWAATIVSAIVGVVFSAGLSHAKLTDIEVRLSVQEAAREQAVQADHGHDLSIQQLKLTLGNMNEGIQQINRKLDKLGEKR